MTGYSPAAVVTLWENGALNKLLCLKVNDISSVDRAKNIIEGRRSSLTYFRILLSLVLLTLALSFVVMAFDLQTRFSSELWTPHGIVGALIIVNLFIALLLTFSVLEVWTESVRAADFAKDGPGHDLMKVMSALCLLPGDCASYGMATFRQKAEERMIEITYALIEAETNSASKLGDLELGHTVTWTRDNVNERFDSLAKFDFVDQDPGWAPFEKIARQRFEADRVALRLKASEPVAA